MDEHLDRFQGFIKETQDYPDRYGKLVHLAVQRHLRDQESITDPNFPYYFDTEAGTRVCRFLEKLYQSKGEWNRRQLYLYPFQVFMVMSLFGWKYKDTKLRRFKISYLSFARGNGKSTLSAGLALFMSMADGEQSAEVYLAANSLQQAGIIFDQCSQTVTLTPGLGKHLRCQKLSIFHKKTFSVIKKIASDASTLDGMLPHAFIGDEIHEWRNSKLWNVIRGGLGKRRQPLMVGITTAGFDQTAFGFKLYSYAKDVLEGTIEDPSFFGYIANIDEDDDPFDEAVWIKANPLLDVAVSREDMRQQARASKLDPVERDDFIIKRLNKYTALSSGWLGQEVWDTATKTIPEEDLEGLECFGGLDASRSGDFTVYALTFPSLNNYTIFRYFLPSKDFRLRVEFENNSYQKWVEEGHLKLSDGPIIDEEMVVSSILADAEKFKLKEIGFDPAYFQSASRKLEAAGINIVRFAQAPGKMYVSTYNLTKALQLNQVAISDNPITRWCADNVKLEYNTAGEFKPIKGSNPRKRIDGIIALLISYNVSLSVAERMEDKKPVFEIPFTFL